MALDGGALALHPYFSRDRLLFLIPCKHQLNSHNDNRSKVYPCRSTFLHFFHFYLPTATQAGPPRSPRTTEQRARERNHFITHHLNSSFHSDHSTTKQAFTHFNNHLNLLQLLPIQE